MKKTILTFTIIFMSLYLNSCNQNTEFIEKEDTMLKIRENYKSEMLSLSQAIRASARLNISLKKLDIQKFEKDILNADENQYSLSTGAKESYEKVQQVSKKRWKPTKEAYSSFLNTQVHLSEGVKQYQNEIFQIFKNIPLSYQTPLKDSGEIDTEDFTKHLVTQFTELEDNIERNRQLSLDDKRVLFAVTSSCIYLMGDIIDIAYTLASKKQNDVFSNSRVECWLCNLFGEVVNVVTTIVVAVVTVVSDVIVGAIQGAIYGGIGGTFIGFPIQGMIAGATLGGLLEGIGSLLDYANGNGQYVCIMQSFYC